MKIIERNNHLFSGVLLSDLSDHLPVFCLVSYYKNNDKSAQNHIIKHRKLTDDILRQMNIAVGDINWDFLDGLTVNGAYEQFIVNIQHILNTHAPLKTIKIPPKYTIRDPWMTPNLLKVSRTCTKLYRKCIGKQRSDTKNTLNTAMSRPIIILSAQPNKHTIMKFSLNIETTFEIRGKLSTL